MRAAIEHREIVNRKSEIVHDLKFRIPWLAWLAEPVIGGFFIGHIAGRTLARFKDYLEHGK